MAVHENHEHIVSSFDDELTGLSRMIADMGDIAKHMVSDSAVALLSQNPDLARTTIKSDKQLDELERTIEDNAILLIAKRQPMAQDLRQIVVAFRVSSDLERIGDLAKNIAKRGLAIEDERLGKKLVKRITHMAALCITQLERVLNSYASHDTAMALRVWEEDEEIDALYNSLFRELLTYMMEDPRTIGHSTHLLFCAKNLERIGDHATNIAETVYYLVTGEQLGDDRPKRTETVCITDPA